MPSSCSKKKRKKKTIENFKGNGVHNILNEKGPDFYPLRPYIIFAVVVVCLYFYVVKAVVRLSHMSSHLNDTMDIFFPILIQSSSCPVLDSHWHRAMRLRHNRQKRYDNFHYGRISMLTSPEGPRILGYVDPIVEEDPFLF